jgi:hypothetical protein
MILKADVSNLIYIEIYLKKIHMAVTISINNENKIDQDQNDNPG